MDTPRVDTLHDPQGCALSRTLPQRLDRGGNRVGLDVPLGTVVYLSANRFHQVVPEGLSHAWRSSRDDRTPRTRLQVKGVQ